MQVVICPRYNLLLGELRDGLPESDEDRGEEYPTVIVEEEGETEDIFNITQQRW